MSESALVAKIKRALDKDRPGFWVKIHGGPFQLIGLPDLIGCYEGRFYGLEVKLPGKEDTLTPRQQYILDQIRQVGKGVAGMVTSVEQALSIVRPAKLPRAGAQKGPSGRSK